MQTNRAEQLNKLSETAVNGRIIHKIDLIGMVRICGVHYFNVYRRYNSVYEIVVEDSNGDFYVQRDNRLRYSIGKVLCLSEEQMNSMYTTELYSFRHGGTPPTSSPVPENMAWSEIHREWCGIEINLRGVLEDYHEFVSRFYSSRSQSDEDNDEDKDDSSSDMDRSDSVKEEKYNDNGDDDSDDDDDSDMPALVSDSEEDEPETPPRNTVIHPPSAPIRPEPVHIHIHHTTPVCCRNLAEALHRVVHTKRTYEQYSESDKELSDKGSTDNEESDKGSEENSSEESNSEDEVSVKEEESEEEEEEPRRGCGPDEYIILRNGTKYRKIN